MSRVCDEFNNGEKINQKEIEKPGIFYLKEWRVKHRFTTPEWEAYVEASNGRTLVFGLVCFIAGIFVSYGLFVR